MQLRIKFDTVSVLPYDAEILAPSLPLSLNDKEQFQCHNKHAKIEVAAQNIEFFNVPNGQAILKKIICS